MAVLIVLSPCSWHTPAILIWLIPADNLGYVICVVQKPSISGGRVVCVVI